MCNTTSATAGSMKAHCENQAECLKMIQAVLDGSATEVEKSHFRDNIDKCLPCIEMYELEKNMKESLQSRIAKVICPKQIEADIRAKLSLVA